MTSHPNLLWASLISLILLPCLQHLFRRTDSNWVAVPVAVLMYLPGVLFVWGGIDGVSRDLPFGSRWKYLYELQHMPLFFLYVLVIAFISLALCWYSERLSNRAGCPGRERTGYMRWVLLSFLLVTTGFLFFAYYISTYATLADAVSANNVELTKRRLFFNIEGLGPNDGNVVEMGSGHLWTFPVLPIAVQNNSREMVDLLLEHGAELNPSNWDQYVKHPSGLFVCNPLYFAVEQENIPMLDYLIAKGAAPSLGVLPALEFNKVSLMKYFLEKGARVDVARKVIWREKKSNERLDDILAVIGHVVPKDADIHGR